MNVRMHMQVNLQLVHKLVGRMVFVDKLEQVGSFVVLKGHMDP